MTPEKMVFLVHLRKKGRRRKRPADEQRGQWRGAEIQSHVRLDTDYVMFIALLGWTENSCQIPRA